MLRISLGAFVVFGILALLTARVLDAESPRALIHRGCWHLKLLLMCGAMAGFLFVPGDGVRNGYGWLARVCSGLFLCAQVVILLDAVYRWNQWWVDEFDKWKWALVTSSLVLFGCGIALTAVSYVYYVPNSGCSTNLAVVTVSLVLSLVLTLISVAFENNSAGLLTSAAFFAYTMFLVWSALGSQPPEEPCNTLGLEAGSTWVQIISFALVFASLVVNAFSSTGSSDAFAVAKVDAAVEKLGAEDTKSREASLYGEDNKRPLWKYCYSHVLITLAVAYSAMLLTGWELSDTDGDTQELLDTGWAPFWIKVSGARTRACVGVLLCSAKERARVPSISLLSRRCASAADGADRCARFRLPQPGSGWRFTGGLWSPQLSSLPETLGREWHRMHGEWVLVRRALHPCGSFLTVYYYYSPSRDGAQGAPPMRARTKLLQLLRRSEARFAPVQHGVALAQLPACSGRRLRHCSLHARDLLQLVQRLALVAHATQPTHAAEHCPRACTHLLAAEYLEEPAAAMLHGQPQAPHLVVVRAHVLEVDARCLLLRDDGENEEVHVQRAARRLPPAAVPNRELGVAVHAVAA